MSWIHKITMPDGTVTPGIWNWGGPDSEHFNFPNDLSGKSVLDVGTLDGYWAIEAKKRGATTVLAIDIYSPPKKEAVLACGAFGVSKKKPPCRVDQGGPLRRAWERSQPREGRPFMRRCDSRL